MIDFNDNSASHVEPSEVDRDELRAALIARIESVLQKLYPEGRSRRGRFQIGDARGARGDSLEVVLEGGKAGLWVDRATNEGGDIFDLIAAYEGLDTRHDFGLVVRKASELVHSAPVIPLRRMSAEPPTDDLGPATAKWEYTDAQGHLLAVVYRFDPPGRRKEFRPWDVRRRKMTPPDPRPLYNQAGLSNAHTIVLAEGERSAQSLIDIGVVATTAMQGAHAPVDKTDWSPLSEKNVLIWPDRDKAGWEYATHAAHAALRAGAKRCDILYPPEDATDGWDAVDAVAEGFDVANFLSHGARLSIDRSPLEAVPVLDRSNHTPKIVLRAISEIVAEKRTVKWLLPKTIEAGVLAVMAGKRGTFKSFIALDWLLRIAQTGKPAVLLSGEGAGLDRRIDAWMQTYGLDTPIKTLPVLALERVINLHAKEVMQGLVQAIDTANIEPAIICVDTFSKYTAGLDENSNVEVASFLTDLGESLRDRYRSTVLLVAHTGHGEGKRPRGAYALMANPDSEHVVERTEGTMMVTVTRERYKDAPSLEPLVYNAESVDLGRVDELGDRVSSLILRATEQPAPRPRAKGVNQTKALVAFKEWSRANPEAIHITSPDISALLKAQGIQRTRRPEALNYLVNSRILTSAIGGFTLHRDML